MQGIIVPVESNVSVNSGSKVFLNNGLDLVVQADAAGSGSLIDMNASNAILFSGGGEAKVELFLSENNWHYSSSPIEQGLTSIFWGIYVKQFSEPDSSWFYITSPDSVFNPMQGYAVWSKSATTGDTTVTFGGILNTGNYSKTLTKSGLASHGSKGFNFVGNPYASAINWQIGSEGWTRTNIDPIIYIWNPVAGQYGSFNRNSKIGTNDIDSIIPAKQGFFVHVSESGEGYLAVNNNARLHSHKAFFKSSQIEEYPQLLRLNIIGNGYSDESIICFDEDATSAYDYEFDAFKLNGKDEAPQLFSKVGDTELAVNALNSIEDNEIIPMYFKSGKTGEYMLTATNVESFDESIPIWLEDVKIAYFHNLRENPVYSFYSNTEDELSRFKIHFAAPDAIDQQSLQDLIQIYSENSTIHINLPEGLQGEIDVYNILGQHLQNVKSVQSENQIHVWQNNTIFIVVIRTNQGTITNKILAE